MFQDLVLRFSAGSRGLPGEAQLPTTLAHGGRFADIAEARGWLKDFVRWYNESHVHSEVLSSSCRVAP